MSEIQYRIVYADGNEEILTINASSVNAGYSRVLRVARLPVDGIEQEIDSIEFWELVS